MSDSGKWAVVYDCDGTLISKMAGALMPIVGRHALPSEVLTRMAVIKAKYVGPYEAGTLTGFQYRQWLFEEFELYIRYSLSVADWQAALRHVRLRPGVVELMTQLHAAGVPQCVVSGAVGDFVDYVLEVNGARHLVDAVYAARLRHDPRGTVIGYDEGSLVDMDNKGEWSMYFAGLHRVAPQRVVALGDSIGDRRLGHLRANRVGIAESEVEAARLRNLGIMGQVVIIDDRLEPVATAIKRLIRLPSV